MKPLPTPGTTTGPQWAQMLNDALTELQGLHTASAAVVTTATSSGSTGNAAVTLPSTGFAVGDALFIFAGSNYAVSTYPTGWTLLQLTSGSFHNAAVLMKIAAASDLGSTVTVAFTGSELWDAHFVAVRGAHRVNDSGVAQGTSGATAVTAYAAGGMLGDFVLGFSSVRAGSGIAIVPSGATAVTAPFTSAGGLTSQVYSFHATTLAPSTGSTATTSSGIGVALVSLG